jgi:hypothetical protein
MRERFPDRAAPRSQLSGPMGHGRPDVGQAYGTGIAWDLVTSQAITLVHVVRELLARWSNLRPPLAQVGGPKPVLGPLLRTVAGGSLFRRS